MMSVSSICRTYGWHKVLDSLSFSVDRGEVLGFIGPNGAGKTTTMRILCGILPPDSGTVSISGVDMWKNPVAAKRNLGYLPENAPFYPGMTVSSFLNYCGRIRGLSGRRLSALSSEAVDRCGIRSVLNREIESLSKGFKRRVCLAQAIIHQPENLVLDEPTDGLDPDQKRQIRDLISEIRKNTAIIVSTHILEEIDSVCTRVLAIRSGKTVFSGSTAEFRALSPEDGSAEIIVSAIPEELLRALTDSGMTSRTEIRQIDGKTVLRLYPGKLSGGELLAWTVSAHPELKPLDCRVLRAELQTVFAGLGKGETVV